MFFTGVIIAAFLAKIESKEWKIDDRERATIIMGVGSQFKSDASSIIGVGQNGVGNYGSVYNSAIDTWTKSENVNLLMVMDAAMTQSGNSMLITGMGNAVSTDGGKTFTKDASLLGVSQAAYTFGDGESFGVVGTMTLRGNGGVTNSDGVASSSDGGKSWHLSASVPEGMPRYGAFPSQDVWYVSQGIWNTDEVAESEEGRYHAMSAHVKKDKKLGGAKFTQSPRKWPANVKDDVNATGWWGAVSKTTDGGKTWTQVLRTNAETDYVYFNQISCGTPDNCIVVGEGTQPDGTDLTVTYTTSDGGKTWSKVVPGTGDISMMTARFTAPNEAWVGGATQSGRDMVGQFYRTIDGGKSFQLAQSVTGCYPIDIDFGVEMGTAACISSSGQSASVAFYK